MNKMIFLADVQSTLPPGVTVIDETAFEFTIAEMHGLKWWVSYLILRHQEYRAAQLPAIHYALVSPRLRLHLHLLPSVRAEMEPLAIFLSPHELKFADEILMRWHGNDRNGTDG